MTLTPNDTLGIVAGTLTTISFIPQVLRIVQTRSAQDISWVMFTVFATGTALWLVWGIAQGALPVIIANFITLVLAIVIMLLKWRYAAAGRGK
jgi:MtN3 and saliva related transmembrane protein